MMTFSKTDNSLTVVVMENGQTKVLTTTSSNPRWADILTALRNNDQAELVQLMSVKNLVERYTENNVEIRDGNVFYRGRALFGLDVDRLLEYVRDGIPCLRLLRFLDRKMQNPSYRAIQELYKFLEHREMTLTEKGTVVGYKGVQENYYSIMGNTATVILSGQTDSGGHILNTVGQKVRCDRSCVCDDYRQGCSPGLHIGSLAYAKSWGPRVMVVEFDPADVVSVPDDCNCQKLRACAYEVIGEFKGEVIREVAEVTSNDKEEDGDLEDQGCGDSTCQECNPNSTCNCQSTPANERDNAYKDGLNQGIKDGKAHKARKHLLTDEDSDDLTTKERAYIEGYNDGYRKSRYGK